MKRGLIKIWFFCFFALVSELIAASASFEAFVDKSEISSLETLTLTLEYSGPAKETPDLSPLEEDFAIVSQQTSSESTFVNGNYSQKTRFIFEIYPKKNKKNLVIPSIDFAGLKTKPIQITQNEGKPQSVDDDVVLLVTANRDRVYVNAELILHIEIRAKTSLRNGTLTEPEIKDAIVVPLVDTEQGELIDQGIKYQVFKKSYAIFPSKPGSLQIPALRFNGISAASPGGDKGFNNFFSIGSRVSARSSPLEITVLDVPNAFPKDQPFLPVKTFLVIESFDEPEPKFEVNKPVIRHFEMKAQGTLPSFLPTLALPVVDGVQVYGEEPKRDQKNGEDGVEANLKISHTYMPTAKKELVIPEQTIYWWDTESDTLKTSVIRPLTMQVTGDAKALLPTAEKNDPKKILEEPSAKEVIVQRKLWPFLVLFALTTLVVILVALWGWRRYRAWLLTDEAQFRGLIKNILVACKAKDMRASYRALQSLRAWVFSHRYEQVLSPDLQSIMREIESAVFDPNASLDQSLFLACRRELLRLKLKTKKVAGLEPLYPV